MTGVGERISELGIIPVAVIHDAANAIPLADALIAGGLPCVEVTFRTDAAEDSIRMITESRSEVLVGAGTVLSVDQARRAVDAGAQFVVAPGFDAEVVDYCMGRDVTVCPGCATASEITQAYKRGLRVVKFFPCGELGGLQAIKTLAAPFSGMRFMPTGGINVGNVAEYLADEKIVACGGSWLAPAQLISDGAFEEIEGRVRAAIELVKATRG